MIQVDDASSSEDESNNRNLTSLQNMNNDKGSL